MTHALYRISRIACPAQDRPWLDALFAELDSVDSGRARLLWLLGTAGFLVDRRVLRFSALLTPVTLLCFAALLISGWMALIEFEGLLPEDDWYGPIALLFTAGLIGAVVLNTRNPSRSPGP